MIPREANIAYGRRLRSRWVRDRAALTLEAKVTIYEILSYGYYKKDAYTYVSDSDFDLLAKELLASYAPWMSVHGITREDFQAGTGFALKDSYHFEPLFAGWVAQAEEDLDAADML